MSSKRSRNSSSKLKRARFGAKSTVTTTVTKRAKSAPQLDAKLVRQVKGLVAGKHRYCANIVRMSALTSAANKATSCLTSTTAFGTAASGTGLVDADCDETYIDAVRIKGEIINACVTRGDLTGYYDPSVRLLLVWFKKPLLVADSAGTLPPITEVLDGNGGTPTPDALPFTPASNGGRFVILKDKTYHLGSNTQADAIGGNRAISGKSHLDIDWKVKVGRLMKYNQESVAGGPNSGGHYDSDVIYGQVRTGLLVLYQIASITGNPVIYVNLQTQLQYTA